MEGHLPWPAGCSWPLTSTSGAAGSVVGADHAGACVGALLTGLVLVPVFGTATASLLLVGIKLASAGLLLIARFLSRRV